MIEEIITNPALLLTCIGILIYLLTKPKEYENNSVRLVITGICVNCDRKVELTRAGTCAYCLSESIIKRHPVRLVSEGQRLVRKLKG